jgi:hypothetical protein
MQAFIVETANRPGELAREAAAIAARGVNIEAFCLTVGDRGATAFLAHDEAAVRSALSDAGLAYREVPVLTVALEDKPGMVATTAKRLADAGVNIELFAPVDYRTGREATVAIGVDKIDDARRALADQLTDWMVPQKVHTGSATR